MKTVCIKYSVYFLLSFSLFVSALNGYSQNVAVTDDDAYTANSSAMLDVKSTTKGFLAPRLSTTERNNILSPAAGLLVYDNTVNRYYVYNGSAWVDLSSNSVSGPFWSYTSPYVYLTNSTDYVGLGTTSPLHKLHLYQSVATTDGTDGTIIDIQNSNASTGVMSGIRFFNGTTLNTAKGGVFYRDRLSYGRGDLILANRVELDQVNVSSSDARLVVKSEGNVEIIGHTGADPNAALFHVQNGDGDTIFAVYPYGVRIYVKDDPAVKAVGSRGGFAVGGFSSVKGLLTHEYLRVTPDSVRIYVDEDFIPVKATGSRGGFAVGGFSEVKGFTDNNFLYVNDDSTRVYTRTDVSNNTAGFGVETFDASNVSYMDITTRNYFIGHESGQKITATCNYNSVLGYQAAHELTSGSDNSMIGYMAGYTTTTGYRNVFLGKEAGYTNQDGYSNVFIGYRSGYFNTGGDHNTYIGSETGYRNTTANYNCALGYRAGYNVTSGSENTFLGYQAGYSNNIGIRNIMIGYQAGYSNTSGNYNSFIGYKAGYNNLTGNHNMFYGYECGYSNTTGSENLFVGYDAGRANTTGTGNMYIGAYAGQVNTSGSDNTFIGVGAGAYALSYNNTFIGRMAGYSATSGHSNVYLGAKAGYSNSSGYYNVFIGNLSGQNASGTGNVFIGNMTGMSETGNNKLYIDNSSDVNPLIWGDFNSNLLKFNGYVGVNYTPSNIYGLWVSGGTSSLYSMYVAKGAITNGTWATSSDIKWKRDVQTLAGTLEKLDQIRGVSYYFKTEDFPEEGFSERKQIGVIAQELEAVFPELVFTDDNGDKSVDYGKLSAVLLQAVKEQQKTIQNMEQRIQQLESK